MYSYFRIHPALRYCLTAEVGRIHDGWGKLAMAAVLLDISKIAETTEGLIVGKSRQMRDIRDLVGRVARSDASVMITGPSGSGKEVVAQAIHASSTRRHRPFVPINCGAIPPELIESELFGHERGAFTGAHARRLGRFEEADGGTLFLDEIGDMRFDMQVKLLRVLEDRLITRVGGTQSTRVDVRIICATHQDIETAIKENRFRQDLYFRLGVLPIKMPALADHAEDVPQLIEHFQDLLGTRSAARFSHCAIERLQRHPWTGNVRELRNVVERANVLFAGLAVSARDVEQLLGFAPPAEDTFTSIGPRLAANDEPSGSNTDGPIDLRALLETMELERIQMALDKANGVVTEAARLLTLKRTTLIEKMRKYSLDRG